MFKMIALKITDAENVSYRFDLRFVYFVFTFVRPKKTETINTFFPDPTHYGCIWLNQRATLDDFAETQEQFLSFCDRT